MSTSIVWPGREGVQVEDREVRPTSYYGLEDTEEALQASRKDPANVKPMVIPNSRS